MFQSHLTYSDLPLTHSRVVLKTVTQLIRHFSFLLTHYLSFTHVALSLILPLTLSASFPQVIRRRSDVGPNTPNRLLSQARRESSKHSLPLSNSLGNASGGSNTHVIPPLFLSFFLSLPLSSAHTKTHFFHECKGPLPSPPFGTPWYKKMMVT